MLPQARHRGTKDRECPICHKWFYSSSYWRHMTLVHPKKNKLVHQCEICHRTFPQVGLRVQFFCFPNMCCYFRSGLFLGIFKKLKAQKSQPLKKTQGHFFAEKLTMSGFFEASYKNSMQMTSISIHFLKQMVSIDNYKEDNFFSSNK